MTTPRTSPNDPTNVSQSDRPSPPTPDGDWFWVPVQRKWLRWNEIQEIVHEEIAQNYIEKLHQGYGGSDIVNRSPVEQSLNRRQDRERS